MGDRPRSAWSSLRSTRGQSTTEYLLKAALVVGMILIVAQLFKGFMPDLFSRIMGYISSAAEMVSNESGDGGEGGNWNGGEGGDWKNGEGGKDQGGGKGEKGKGGGSASLAGGGGLLGSPGKGGGGGPGGGKDGKNGEKKSTGAGFLSSLFGLGGGGKGGDSRSDSGKSSSDRGGSKNGGSSNGPGGGPSGGGGGGSGSSGNDAYAGYTSGKNIEGGDPGKYYFLTQSQVREQQNSPDAKKFSMSDIGSAGGRALSSEELQSVKNVGRDGMTFGSWVSGVNQKEGKDPCSLSSCKQGSFDSPGTVRHWDGNDWK